MRNFFILLMITGLVACGGGRKAEKPTTPVKLEPRVVQTFVGGNPKFADSDPVDFKGRAPSRYPVHGIDAARFQKSVDWNTARRNGVNFAFIKATEGGDYLDPMFQEHWNGARRAGLRHGAYHFYYFCRTPEEQARWFIRNVPKEASSLPPVLDIEWNHASPSCKRRPSGAEARHEAERFIKKITAHYGRRPVVYTTVDFYRDTDIGRLKGVDFWLRSVAGHPEQVYPGAHWAFWQYTGTGSVPGIKGNVDLNVFGGGAENWLQWLGYRKYLPLEAPAGDEAQTVAVSN